MDGIAQDLPAPIAIDPEATANHSTRTARDARDLAFSALIDRHARFLYRVAFGLLRNPEDAEDAVQDTFLKLYRNDAWQHMEDEKAYLARAVWRTGLDRRTTAGAIAMKNSQDITELDLPGTGDSPEHTAIANADRTLLKALIQALPESLRQPLILTHIDGMKSQEVAAILGIPDGTVRSRINRAKAELQEKFLAATKAPREARS